MHETMVAQNLLTVILQEAEKQNAKPVRAKISCGKLNALNDDVLAFAFQAIAKDTVCDNMKLEIEHKAIQGRCNHCSLTFDVELATATCPKCGGSDLELLADAPLVLEQIEFEQE